SDLGDDGMSVVKRDAETGIGQDFSNETAHFDEFFFCHVYSFCGANVIHGRNCGWDQDAGSKASDDAFYGTDLRRFARMGLLPRMLRLKRRVQECGLAERRSVPPRGLSAEAAALPG